YGRVEAKMKKKWTNNIGIKILSVAIAFLLWVVIINIEDPTTSRTFRVKVDILNDEVVESSGKVYKITEGDFVEVTVKGNKSYVDSLSDSDITATADFRYLSNYGSVPITAKCTKYTTTKYSVELGSVDHVLVKLEDKDQGKFIVLFNLVGEPPAGYYVDTNLITSNPTKITVYGGESIIKSISTVQVDIDASNQTSNFKDKLVPKIYDSSGNLIDSSNVKCSVSEVSVTVTVLRTKKVPVNITLTGKPAHGYKAEDPVYDPTEITIAGTKANLDQINSVELTIPIDNASETIQRTIDLKESVLPEYIYIDGDKTSVNIDVAIEPLESKEITFNSSDIAVKLTSETATYNFVDPNQQFTVRVFAVKGELDDITIDSLKPTIDLTDKKFGTHNVEIKFTDSYLIEPVNSIKVKVTLAKPADIDSEQGEQQTEPVPTAPIVTQTPEPTVEPTQEPTATPENTPDDSEEAVATD
ncbi:MAG: CdaR family protein, partial [bacterium]|nr:CdaR family protein [bacterium]